MLPFTPGRTTADKKRAFLAIISTMLAALAIARVLPDPAQRATVLATARAFLLHQTPASHSLDANLRLPTDNLPPFY